MKRPSYTCIDLRKVPVASSLALDSAFVHSVRFEEFKDQAYGQLVQALRGFVLGLDLPDRVFKFPASPWDHFKVSFFPKWLLEKFPAKFQSLKLEATVIYPNYRKALPEQDQWVRIAVFEKPSCGFVEESYRRGTQDVP